MEPVTVKKRNTQQK